MYIVTHIIDTGTTVRFENSGALVCEFLKKNFFDAKVDIEKKDVLDVFYKNGQQLTFKLDFDFKNVVSPVYPTIDQLRIYIISICSVDLQSIQSISTNVQEIVDREEEPKIVDSVSSSLTYIGFADANSLTSDPVWMIKRIVTIGNITTIEYATSYRNRTNIWDNRASLTYVL